jgi:alkanesulfonate monooxygenase SsuD/methylene tetrahydromethanopterin reductase-like flavin-dependent oxidoreductase (luciferase family)
VQVGLLSLGDLITDPVTGRRATPSERHRSLVDQAVLAEQVGFTSVHLGEHHFCEYILSAPAVVLAAIAERTTTLRLSTGVTLGVNNDPVRLAEDYATVDVLSGGRVEPVVGRGTFFPHTFAGFGQDPRHAKAVFAEHLELLVRLWTEEEVTWRGDHHTPVTALTTHPRPHQRPRPPIWVGAGASPDSVDLAARLGLWLMLPTVFGTPEAFRPMVELYEERWEAYGHDPADRRVGCCTHAFVAATRAEARRVWEPRYRAYIEWVNDLVERSTGGRSGGLGGFDFDERCATTAMCGSPAEIVDRMGQLRDLLHLDTQLLMFDMGGLPDAELRAVIELAGTEVVAKVNAKVRGDHG